MEISVIIPVYNKADYIEDCVKSLMGQDFADFEVVLVNDGSTDNSGEICDRLAEEHERIRVFHTENGGVTAARRH
ncbi:MAG: glycosyltransferase, partial [Prevotella sp.]|nr:glycosyltransferase [Prevotella sp.]